MVEPSNNGQLPPQEATRTDLVRMAREDKHTLTLLSLSEGDAIFADPDHYKRRLLARQIEFFIELHPKDYMRCVVCEEYDAAAWLDRGMPLDLAKHCSAHAEEFHARLPLRPHCCVPLYHPLSDYEWRAHAPRLRALEGERHQRERQDIMQVEQQQPQVYQARLDRYLGKRTYNQRIEHAGARDSVHANTQVQVPAVESSLAQRVGWDDLRDEQYREPSESSSVEFIESDSVQIVDTDSVQIVEQASSRTNQQPPR